MNVTASMRERDRRSRMSGWTWALATGLVVLLTASGRLAAQTDAKPGDEAKGQAEAQAAVGQEPGAVPTKPEAAQPAPGSEQKKAEGEMVGPVPEDCHSKTPPPTPGENPEGKAPRLVCEQMKYTVDNLWSGQQIECVFNIRNEGDAALQIKAAGGWGTKYNGRSDRTIEPGKTEALIVYLNSSRYRNSFTKNIQLTSNDPTMPSSTLTCEGKMRTAMNFEPEVLNLGQISRDSGEIKKTVAIRKGDGGPIKPEIIPTTNQNTTVALREIEAGESYELDLTVAPPWPGGRLVETVRLKTGVTETPEMSFTISGSLPPRLTATPRYFTFPMSRSEDVTETVRLNWSDDKPGKIQSMTTTLPGGQVKVEGEGAEQVVSLTVPADASGTRGQMQVVLTTDDQAVPNMRIPIVFRERPFNRSTPLRIPSGTGEQAKGAQTDVPKREEPKQ